MAFFANQKDTNFQSNGLWPKTKTKFGSVIVAIACISSIADTSSRFLSPARWLQFESRYRS